MYKEVLSIIGILIVVLDLIITGIIGLVKKEIYTRKIFLRAFYLPLGLIGSIFERFYSGRNNKLDKGDTAVFSSIATIALGLFIAIFFGFYYLDIYQIMDYDTIEIIVPRLLIGIIIFIILAIIFHAIKSKRN